MRKERILWPIGAGLAGATFLAALYFGLVSWAESPQHAASLFWQERGAVVPLILGFGVQVGLYTILKKRLFLPAGLPALAGTGSSGALTGASGATSTAAMLACCAHHAADALPILGLTAAATFLARYQALFLRVGLGTTLFGIASMLFLLARERRKFILQFAALLFALALSACSAAQGANPAAALAAETPPAAGEKSGAAPSAAPQGEPGSPTAKPGGDWPEGLTRQDAQGAIEVAVTPLNLANPGETLDFEVSLNTHSVDLSMDLASLATLRTDTGLTVAASAWEAPRGGHHVSGTLSFPATVEGASLLEGARRLDLTLANLDASARIFTWER